MSDNSEERKLHPDLLTVKEVAVILGRPVYYVYDLAKKGILPVYREEPSDGSGLPSVMTFHKQSLRRYLGDYPADDPYMPPQIVHEFTVKQVAEHWGVSEYMVRKEIEEGNLPGARKRDRQMQWEDTKQRQKRKAEGREENAQEKERRLRSRRGGGYLIPRSAIRHYRLYKQRQQRDAYEEEQREQERQRERRRIEQQARRRKQRAELENSPEGLAKRAKLRDKRVQQELDRAERVRRRYQKNNLRPLTPEQRERAGQRLKELRKDPDFNERRMAGRYRDLLPPTLQDTPDCLVWVYRHIQHHQKVCAYDKLVERLEKLATRLGHWLVRQQRPLENLKEKYEEYFMLQEAKQVQREERDRIERELAEVRRQIAKWEPRRDAAYEAMSEAGRRKREVWQRLSEDERKELSDYFDV